MKKVQILRESPDKNDDTAHLRPIIHFLRLHGNEPEVEDRFIYNRAGAGEYYFKNPIDRSLLEKYFDFPETIVIGRYGDLSDVKNALHLIGGNSILSEPPADNNPPRHYKKFPLI